MSPRLLAVLTLLTLATSFVPGSARAVSVLTNGGFEAGDLSGWSTSGLGTSGFCPNDLRDWNVDASGLGTGCSPVGDPPGGSFAAYVMNDGTAGTVYQLSQTFIVPSTVLAADLSWSQSIVSNYSGLPRTFEVQLYDQFSALLATVFSTPIAFSDPDPLWTTRTLDLTSLLASQAGNPVELRFVNAIPDAWTGPAGLGLDDVSIEVLVPEPSTAALLGAALVALAGGRRRR
ncbi:MAG: PEP-CTERM sorting domain-containing protein [Myxococcota bacterium]